MYFSSYGDVVFTLSSLAVSHEDEKLIERMIQRYTVQAQSPDELLSNAIKTAFEEADDFSKVLLAKYFQHDESGTCNCVTVDGWCC